MEFLALIGMILLGIAAFTFAMVLLEALLPFILVGCVIIAVVYIIAHLLGVPPMVVVVIIIIGVVAFVAFALLHESESQKTS